MSNYIFAIHDSDKDIRMREGAKNIKVNEAEKYNSLGYGIFRTVQSFKSEKRTADNIDKLISYAIDIDDWSKDDQTKRVFKINVEPSRVVETKSGFHIYFDLIGESNPNLYTKFLTEYLIPLYNACNGAKDLSRILRVPGYWHCKDINNKFMVKKIFESAIKYKQDDLHKTFYDKYQLFKKEFLIISEAQYKNYHVTPTGVNKSAHEIAMALGGKRSRENEYWARCPVHHDTDPSFHITQKGEKVLFYCHGSGKCSQSDVFKKLKELGLW